MKLTKTLIKSFEKDQESYGTSIALHNILWLLAAELFHDIGLRHIKTR